MTITADPVRNQYTATALQTVFNYTFKIYASADLNVYLTPAGQASDDAADLITSYTVDSGTIGDESGGFITLDTGAAVGDTLTIVSDISYDRETDYQVNGDFSPETVNGDIDRVVSLVKQNKADIQRAILLPETGSGTGTTLPSASEDKGVKWVSGDLTNTPITETVTSSTAEFTLVSTAGNDVNIRGLKAGQNVVLSDDGTDVTIKASVTGGAGDVGSGLSNTYDGGTVQTMPSLVVDGDNVKDTMDANALASSTADGKAVAAQSTADIADGKADANAISISALEVASNSYLLSEVFTDVTNATYSPTLTTTGVRDYVIDVYYLNTFKPGGACTLDIVPSTGVFSEVKGISNDKLMTVLTSQSSIFLLNSPDDNLSYERFIVKCGDTIIPTIVANYSTVVDPGETGSFVAIFRQV